LILLCQAVALLGSPALRQQGHTWKYQVVSLVLLVPLSFQVYRWYLSARNLGVLEAVTFLQRSASCSADPSRDSEHVESWPFCKPYLTKDVQRPNHYKATNVWGALGAPGDALSIAVSFGGKLAPVRWNVDFRDARMSFEHGRLDLGFDKASLQRIVVKRMPASTNMPITDLKVFDGQNSGEILIE
jgi:hypothetical protein